MVINSLMNLNVDPRLGTTDIVHSTLSMLTAMKSLSKCTNTGCPASHRRRFSLAVNWSVVYSVLFLVLAQLTWTINRSGTKNNTRYQVLSILFQYKKQNRMVPSKAFHAVEIGHESAVWLTGDLSRVYCAYYPMSSGVRSATLLSYKYS